MVQLIMIFLTTTVAVASTIGFMLTILLIAVMAALTLIRVTHPPAPPYRIILLFRQVRIRLGLSPNLSYVADVTAETNTEVGTFINCRCYNSIMHV